VNSSFDRALLSVDEGALLSVDEGALLSVAEGLRKNGIGVSFGQVIS